jgi:hypothetical protein
VGCLQLRGRFNNLSQFRQKIYAGVLFRKK